ncbi:MAG: hypothetical protein E7334_04645 [Clostridiales bacterium]|nr:hypothetical protein [Clostridiales bacterium]MBQ2816738.1 hypothetical protein [Clostridia bacterium]MBQ4638375.1 hypothetical protein [Clostridia bacterium]
MNNWLMKFMSGRYGPDQFSKALLFPGYLLWILGLLINIIFGRTGIGNIIGTVLNWAGLSCIIYSTFRMFSKKIDRRRAENQKYLAFAQKYMPKLNTYRQKLLVYQNRLKQSKTHKFVRCPSCGTVGRIPKGRGRVTVTCISCRHEFKAKS